MLLLLNEWRLLRHARYALLVPKARHPATGAARLGGRPAA